MKHAYNFLKFIYLNLILKDEGYIEVKVNYLWMTS